MRGGHGCCAAGLRKRNVCLPRAPSCWPACRATEPGPRLPPSHAPLPGLLTSFYHCLSPQEAAAAEKQHALAYGVELESASPPSTSTQEAAQALAPAATPASALAPPLRHEQALEDNEGVTEPGSARRRDTKRGVLAAAVDETTSGEEEEEEQADDEMEIAAAEVAAVARRRSAPEKRSDCAARRAVGAAVRTQMRKQAEEEADAGEAGGGRPIEADPIETGSSSESEPDDDHYDDTDSSGSSGVDDSADEDYCVTGADKEVARAKAAHPVARAKEVRRRARAREAAIVLLGSSSDEDDFVAPPRAARGRTPKTKTKKQPHTPAPQVASEDPYAFDLGGNADDDAANKAPAEDGDAAPVSTARQQQHRRGSSTSKVKLKARKATELAAGSDKPKLALKQISTKGAKGKALRPESLDDVDMAPVVWCATSPIDQVGNTVERTAVAAAPASVPPPRKKRRANDAASAAHAVAAGGVPLAIAPQLLKRAQRASLGSVDGAVNVLLELRSNKINLRGSSGVVGKLDDGALDANSIRFSLASPPGGTTNLAVVSLGKDKDKKDKATLEHIIGKGGDVAFVSGSALSQDDEAGGEYALPNSLSSDDANAFHTKPAPGKGGKKKGTAKKGGIKKAQKKR